MINWIALLFCRAAALFCLAIGWWAALVDRLGWHFAVMGTLLAGFCVCMAAINAAVLGIIP